MTLDRRNLSQFASALEQRARKLREEVRSGIARGREENYAALSGSAHDAGDEALADLVVDVGTAEVSRDLAELREIEEAHRRIAAGRYGLCADCGAGIPLARLRAEPAAARCAGCQARHEKTYGR